MATILLVSDDAPSLETARTALVTAGHEVLVAPTPKAVEPKKFDLAIVDLERFEVAAEARLVAGKVVLLSEASHDVTLERVQKTGVQGYLRKLGPERLREDVSYLLT